MNDLHLTVTVVTHQVVGALSRGRRTHVADGDRDRGAVSLEQVLWFVAAGVAVAVIAGILWNQIRDQANTPVTPPTAPSP